MSRTETIRDDRHRIIGYVMSESNGNEKITDEHYKVLGYYQANMDRTVDSTYKVIRQGNQLMRLLD